MEREEGATGCDDVVQQLACAADKRFALFVFVRPWGFSDKEDFRLGISNSEHGLRACRRQFLTPRAMGDSLGQSRQSRNPLRQRQIQRLKGRARTCFPTPCRR